MGGKDRDPFEGRSTQDHTNALRVACAEQQAIWVADVDHHDGGAVAGGRSWSQCTKPRKLLLRYEEEDGCCAYAL